MIRQTLHALAAAGEHALRETAVNAAAVWGKAPERKGRVPRFVKAHALREGCGKTEIGIDLSDGFHICLLQVFCQAGKIAAFNRNVTASGQMTECR